MNDAVPALRERWLRALDVGPLRLRRPSSADVTASAPLAARGEPAGLLTPDEAVASVAPTAPVVATKTAIRRLALQPDPAELDDPAIRNLYAALTEAVGKAGLQRVRVCDVANDSSAAVMVFGAAPLPEGVPLLRVLRADPLSVLHSDRERKRRLWERMQALSRGAGN